MAINYNTRSRNWFLCVQQGASCFEHVPMICDRLASKNCTFAYILHDEERLSTDDEPIKKVHYHILLSFENARTFSSVTGTFNGAHVEVSHVLADCAAYLLHNTDSAIKAGKKQYDVSEIVTNNKTALKSWLGDKGMRLRPFNPERILEYILFDNMRSISRFYMEFGSAIQRYITLISSLLKECSGIQDIPSQCEEIKLNNDLISQGVSSVDITSNSVNYESICTREVELLGERLQLVEFILRYQKWEYMDDAGFCYMEMERPDMYRRMGLPELEGMDISFKIGRMVEAREQALF